MQKLPQTLLLCLLACCALSAQEFRATITGRVTDASGGAIPGAVVQAKNVATNEVTSATSDTQGTYNIPFLRPGDYILTVEAKGFKRYVREGLTLQVGQVAGLTVSMEVGDVSQSIEITAEVPLLDTEKADRGVVVDSQRVAELPLNARNPYLLGAMMSGVTFRGAAIWQRPFDNGAIAEWSMNGGRQSNNEFLMDGAPNNAQMGSNNVAYVPIVDAVQEFKVQSNSYDASYGKFAGGVMNVVLKSGSNDFHATGWEFLRRTPLDANSFQNNATGAKRAEHYLDQYGFQLEGPVRIPKLYDGRNKLFYLGSFENYREGTPTPLFLSYAEPEMRTGDFSKVVDAQGRPITVYNPFTGRADSSVQGGIRRDPFPGNRIPDSLISPISKNILKYMPAPNAKTPGVRYSTNNLLYPDYFAKDKFYNLILKFDYNLGDRHRFFFRHASNDRTEDRNDNGVFSGPGQSGQQPFQRINDAYVLDWVTTITPTLIANVRASNNRFIEKGYGAGNDGFDIASLGFPKNIVSQLPSPTFFGLYNIDDYTALGRYQSINITNSYNLQGNITKIAGQHNMRFGIDVRRNHYIQQNTGNIWRFRFDRAFTREIWNQGDQLSGDSFASFLLGVPTANPNNITDSSSSNYPLFPFFRQWYVAPYFQDDWKITQRLTINVGLRWDINLPPDEKYNRLNSAFDLTAASPIAGQIDKTRFPQFAGLKGGLTFVGVGSQPGRAAYSDRNNFQPRIGAAYKLTDKVVLRAGYGLYYNNPNNDYLQTSGFSTVTPFVHSLDEGRTPRSWNSWGDPYPSILVPAGASGGLNTFVGRSFDWFNPDFKTPYTHQFSVGVQYQVGQNMNLDVSYVGSRSRNQQDGAFSATTGMPVNIPTLAFRKQCNPLEGGSVSYCNELQANPFKGIEAFRGTSFFTQDNLSRFQLARPFPQFSGDLVMRGTNLGYINYNSVQINYTYRMKGGVNLLANYTLSKMYENNGFLDPYAGVRQGGLYALDRPHYLKATVVWELPFGKGRRFGANSSGILSKLISGWEYTTYYTHASGEPTDLPSNVRILKDPRLPGGGWDGNIQSKQYQVRGWNPCVLRMTNDGKTAPLQYSLDKGCGTDQANYSWLMLPDYAPRETSYRSPNIRKQALFNIDMSINKTTYIGERLRFQIGFEAFNATNFYFYGRNSGFINNPLDPNFGTIFPHQQSNQNGQPRQIQVRMKIFW